MSTTPLIIAIHCLGMPFNGETIPSGQSLGGSESACYFMAKELVRLGHKVVVFTTMPKPGRFDGVIYDHIGKVSEQAPLGDRFHYAMKVPWDVVIIQRHPLAFKAPINSKLNIWWTHDLALHRSAPLVDMQLPFLDKVFAVSRFHRDQIASVYGIDKEFITATFNGVDYELFKDVRDNPPRRSVKDLVFASRPERGLEELVAPGGIMEQLGSEYMLHVCGYDNTVPEMEGYYRYLWSRCDELPNVRNHGPLGKADLYQLLARCGAYIYPTTFEDTSNIMLLEANAAGTPFICPADHAALPETGENAGVVFVPLKDGAVDRSGFVAAIKSLLNNDSAWDKLHKKALKKNQTWEQAAKQWEKEFFSLLSEKSSSFLSLAKHFERMSDIVALHKLYGGDVKAIDQVVPDFSSNYDFFLNGTYAEHYEEYYEYEKNRGVNYGPESLDGNPRFEHTVNVIKEANPRTMLDYGCAHGHYVMNILKRAPGIQITGMDINASNIEKARAWALQENPMVMPEFIVGVAADLKEDQKFDLILAAEVLEHVPDPRAVVEKLKQHLNPDGYIVTTTPYGPWEAIGYKEHKGWRAHLHHFERQDLNDLFANQPDFKLIAIPQDYELGHYLVYFKAGGEEVGHIDYDRKFETQAPRETVSLCLIARDAELTIGQTLSKTENIADEVIVVIDEQTGDETAAVCEQFGAKIYYGKSPLEIGFAAARNESIKHAACDWVLWMDADEHFERANNIFKYLRKSPVMGFGIPQHHISEQPAGILKTDFPCRLFRNHRDIQFFGVVHEHPEKKMNDGVGKVHLIQDLGIIHFGYSTEDIRRKRFMRNWPLMMREIKENPDRILGQFLWMRDLAHMAKYLLERTGGQRTPEVMQYASMALEMWEKVLDTKNIRIIADGLQFYSEAVHHLTNGNGIEYELDLKIRKGALAPTVPKLRGYFLNSDHIEKFSKLINEEAVKVYREKYF